MDLTTSQNGYSDYKRKTIEEDENLVEKEDAFKKKPKLPLKSYL